MYSSPILIEFDNKMIETATTTDTSTCVMVSWDGRKVYFENMVYFENKVYFKVYFGL